MTKKSTEYSAPKKTPSCGNNWSDLCKTFRSFRKFNQSSICFSLFRDNAFMSKTHRVANRDLDSKNMIKSAEP